MKFKPLSNEEIKRDYLISPDRTHHINTNGNPSYKNRFLWVLSFHPPNIAAAADKSGAFHINTTGEPIYKKRYLRTFGYYFERAAVILNSKWFHIDISGNRAYSESYKWVGNYQESVCTVRDFDGNYFHIDLKGNPLYLEKFTYAGDFKYGIAVVRTKDGLAHHIDKKGTFLHSGSFIDLDIFHKDYARARDKRGWFHIDLKGNPLYHERYELIEPFYNGFARVVDFDGNIGILSEQGKWISTIYANSENIDYLTQHLQKIFTDYWELQTIVAAIKLNLFEILAEKEFSVSDLAKLIKIPSKNCQKLCNALVLLRLVNRSNLQDSSNLNQILSITTMGSLLTKNHPKSMRDACLVFGEEHYHAWNKLDEALLGLKTGFELYYDKPFFQWIDEHPEKAEIYHNAMARYAEKDYLEIIKEHDFSEHKVVLDVGGGRGVLLSQFLKKYPNSEGFLFDLKESIHSAEDYFNNQHLPNSPSLIIGDFFRPFAELLPRKPDTIFLSRILHDWDDIKAKIIINNCKQALKPNGTLYVFELVPPENPKFDLGVFLNLNMIAITGGKERTYSEFQRLFKECNMEIKENQNFGLITVLSVKKK